MVRQTWGEGATDPNEKSRKEELEMKRNGAVDFWKFVFSVVIMCFHSLYFAGSEKYVFFDGANMVEYFFLVSGFLMAASVMKEGTQSPQPPVWKSTWQFLFHKIKSMCPEYYVAWAVSFLIKQVAGGLLPLHLIAKHAVLSIWELLFLRMAGFNDYNANGATWYISAMLAAMLLLLPLFYKQKEFFLHMLAPVLAVGLIGYLYATEKTMRGNTDWMGICYKGLLRALGVLCLGCVCYLVCQKMKEIPFTPFAKALLSFAETGGCLFALYWTYGHATSKMQFIVLLLFAAAVTISFSHQGLFAPLYDRPAVYWLGRFSFPLFLSHHAWSGRMNRMFPEDTYAQLFPKYLLLSVGTAFAVYVISAWVRKLCAKYKDSLRQLFVQM